MKVLILLVLDLVFLSSCRSATARTQGASAKFDPVAAEKLKDSFFSDYISFVGADSTGQVAFAIDDDRTHKGDQHGVEVHVVMHDERAGYIPISGNGEFTEPGQALVPLASTPDFHFSGDFAHGIHLASEKNKLTLDIDPIVRRIGNQTDSSVIWIGSANAVLHWRNRAIKGRVIYEYLIINKIPHFYSFVSGLMLSGFNGLYLKVGSDGDFYSYLNHGAKGFNGALWNKPLDGMLVLPDTSSTISLEHFTETVSHTKWGFGLFAWPTEWRASWNNGATHGELKLRVIHHKTTTWWFIGGYAMDIVEGELTYGEKTYPVYGLVELII